MTSKIHSEVALAHLKNKQYILIMPKENPKLLQNILDEAPSVETFASDFYTRNKKDIDKSFGIDPLPQSIINYIFYFVYYYNNKFYNKMNKLLKRILTG